MPLALPGASCISNELEMSTVRPDCWPSRQPITRTPPPAPPPLPPAPLVLGPAPPALARMRVWWSEMLIRTSWGWREGGKARENGGR